MKILEIFKYIFENLEKKKIEYLLSGSYALNLYSPPRSTRDIDIVVDLNLQNIDSFLEIFSSGFYFDKKAIIEEIKRRRMFNIIHLDQGFKFDFILKKDDEFSNEQFRRKKYLKIDGFHAWATTAEDLILSKQWIQQSESAFQKRDIEELLSIQNLDKKYIKKWCDTFHLNTFNLM